MKDRTNIPSSPACGQWETLLVDALDGVLRPEDEAVFSNHMATCAACTALFEEARRGREWLEFLAPEPEVPAYLLDKILGETGHGRQLSMDAGKLAIAGGGAQGNVLAMPPAWQRPGFSSRLRRFAEPRLMMTAAMAFFSIALTLSITGVRISGVSMADLRPASVKSYLEKRIMTASTPVVRYYDHLRFVYEVEARMRELRRATDAERKSDPKNQAAPQSAPDGVTHRKDGGSQLNPKDAPQQTVNPRSDLWSSDLLDARLEQPSGQESKKDRSTGIPTLTEASGSILLIGKTETIWVKTSVLATPEWSTTCLA
jgi:hypothetical protein